MLGNGRKSMRKINSLSFVLFLLFQPLIAHAQTPFDIVYHATPVGIAFDIPEEVSQVAGNAQSVINQAKTLIMQTKTAASNMQSAVNSTFEKFKSIADGKTDAFSSGLKMGRPKKYAKKLKKTLLTYKSLKMKDISNTTDIRKRFYYDNLYAIYALSKSLQVEWAADIKPKNAETKTAVDGKGAVSTDEGGKNEVYYVYNQTLTQLDEVMRFWQKVASLKARLIAVKAINNLEPLSATKAENAAIPEDEDETEASEDTTAFILPRGQAGFSSTEPLAFAQVSYKKLDSSLSGVEKSAVGRMSEAVARVTKTLEFVSPEESKNEHPLVDAQEKLDSISVLNEAIPLVNQAIDTHNMLGSIPEYKQAAESYAEMLNKYNEALSKLQESEQCTLKYLNRHFSNPVKIWSGISLGENVNKHELRKGISGWAVEAYETAKAAETSTITADDVGEISQSPEDLALLEDDPVGEKATEAAKKVDASVSTGKMEETQKENRKSALMPWQIGAEASKMLSSNPSQWGGSSHKPMVWNDTKNFYSQYLRRKYDNVKSYLKSYTRNDVLALVVAKLKGENQDISNTKYQKALDEENLQANSEVNQVIANITALAKKQTAATSSAVSGLEKQRQAILAEIEKLNEAIKNRSQQIAEIRSTAEDAATKQIDEMINAKVSFPINGAQMSSPPKDKLVDSSSLKTAISQRRAEETNEQKIASLEQQSARDKKKIEALEKELQDLDEKIAETKLNAQEGGSPERDEGLATIQGIKDKLALALKAKSEGYSADVRQNLMAILTESAKKNPLIVPTVLLARAEEAADDALKSLYKQVDVIIDSSYTQMTALGDKLYTPEGHAQIVTIHNQMIDKVKGLMLVYSVSGLIKVSDIAIYAKLLTADTSVETEGFFVGSSPKARDMKAPYALPDLNLPPVREVFHFDSFDFKAVKPVIKGKKSERRRISASDFLNFGGDIPSVWRYMLADKAFIESDYNLKEALNIGCEDVAFSRGGFMPCVVTGSSIIVDVNDEGEYIERNDLDVGSLPKCLLIKMKKSKPHHVVMDAQVNFASPLSILSGKPNEIPSPTCTYSELGMLLEADENNNLMFRKRSYNAYTLMLDDDDNGKMSKKEKNRRASANHAILSRNQVGGFLEQMEYEKAMQESLAQQKKQYDEKMAELRKKLEEYGFTPSSSFDLNKDSDYQLTINKLKAEKDKQVTLAKSAVDKVEVGKDNPPAKERSDNLKNLLNLMQKDTEAVLNISGTMADANDLETQLKKATVDRKLVDKFKKSLKDQSKDYNDPTEPFCANY